MVILLDTSAIYALADRDDLNHHEALHRFERALEAGHTLLVHNYLILESAALLGRRLGREAARRFLNDVDAFRIRWVDETLHRTAVGRFLKRKGQVSLVDEVSFLVMREEGIRVAFAFDADFAREGFQLYSE